MNEAPRPTHISPEEQGVVGADNTVEFFPTPEPRGLDYDPSDRNEGRTLNMNFRTQSLNFNKAEAAGQYETAWKGLTKGMSVLEVAPKDELRQGRYTLVGSASAQPWFDAEQSGYRFGTTGLEYLEDIRLPYDGGLIADEGTEHIEAAKKEAGTSLAAFRGKDKDGQIYYVVGSREAFERRKDSPDNEEESDIKYIMPGQTLQIGRGDNAWLPKEAKQRETETKRPRISTKQAIIVNDGQGNLWLENLGRNPLRLKNQNEVDSHSYSFNKHHQAESSWDDNWSEFRVGPQTLGQRLREALSGSDELSSLETPYEMRVSSQPGDIGPVQPKEQQEEAAPVYDRRHVFAENVLKGMVARLVSILGGKKILQGTEYQPKHAAKSPKSEK